MGTSTGLSLVGCTRDPSRAATTTGGGLCQWPIGARSKSKACTPAVLQEVVERAPALSSDALLARPDELPRDQQDHPVGGAASWRFRTTTPDLADVCQREAPVPRLGSRLCPDSADTFPAEKPIRCRRRRGARPATRSGPPGRTRPPGTASVRNARPTSVSGRSAVDHRFVALAAGAACLAIPAGDRRDGRTRSRSVSERCRQRAAVRTHWPQQDGSVGGSFPRTRWRQGSCWDWRRRRPNCAAAMPIHPRPQFGCPHHRRMFGSRDARITASGTANA